MPPVEVLHAWYRRHGRHDLPWRQTRDPYHILVAEIMLQQTQVARVVEPYRRWLRRWPTLDALRDARAADVLRQWRGLGYNRRALHLHAIARHLENRPFPREIGELRRLPGVGPYTARAMACFAFGAPFAPLDTNVARVVARHDFGRAPSEVPRGNLQAAADAWVAAQPRDLALALMDLGATVCRIRPDCQQCPLASDCRFEPEDLSQPRRRAPATVRFERTSRYARGRIVDLLRDRAPLEDSAIAGALPPEHRPRVAEYLAALQREGLVEREGTSWSLAEDRIRGE